MDFGRGRETWGNWWLSAGGRALFNRKYGDYEVPLEGLAERDEACGALLTHIWDKRWGPAELSTLLTALASVIKWLPPSVDGAPELQIKLEEAHMSLTALRDVESTDSSAFGLEAAVGLDHVIPLVAQQAYSATNIGNALCSWERGDMKRFETLIRIAEIAPFRPQESEEILAWVASVAQALETHGIDGGLDLGTYTLPNVPEAHPEGPDNGMKNWVRAWSKALSLRPELAGPLCDTWHQVEFRRHQGHDLYWVVYTTVELDSCYSASIEDYRSAHAAAALLPVVFAELRTAAEQYVGMIEDLLKTVRTSSAPTDFDKEGLLPAAWCCSLPGCYPRSWWSRVI